MPKRGTSKFNSDKQEKRVAKELHAKPVIGSGSLWGSKGDVRSDKYLIECKTTSKSFYALSVITWKKIEREATRDGLRIPVMCIDLEDGKHRFAVFRKSTIPCNCELLYFATPKSSYRIKSDAEPLALAFIDNSYYLAILPWETFVEIISE